MNVSNIMNATAASSSAQSGASSSSKSKGDNLTMDDFFQLLSAQLQYQDPMQPTDNSQFMGQMAQFSLLEQVSNLTKTLTLSVTTSALGKVAVFDNLDKDGNVVQDAGVVSAVDLSKDTPQYLINGLWVSQSNIVQLYDPSQLNNGSGSGSGSGSSSGSGSGSSSGSGSGSDKADNV